MSISYCPVRLVTDVYPPDCGGSGWSTHVLAKVLKDRGHDVAVIGINASSSGLVHRTYDGIKVTEVGLASARHNPVLRLGSRDYSYDTLTRYLAYRLSKEPKVGVLHAQHMHSGPPTIAVGRKLGWATILTLRDYWPVCLHGTSWWGSSNCPGCDTDNLTYCMQEYWGWPYLVARTMVGWARRRLRSRELGVSTAHRVFAVSESLRFRIAQEIPAARISVVPNMVDPVSLAASTKVNVDFGAETPYLLSAGKLIPTKGFNILLDFLADTGCVKPLVIAGDGPARGSLEEQAKALGLPVRFLGWISHDRLLNLQRNAHAVLLPSAWNEPLSRIVLETMALSVPVIAWNRGGNAEMIESAVNGWLVSSPGDLALALDALESNECKRRIGEAALKRVVQHYTPDVVYPMIAAQYSSAAEEVV